MGWQVATVFSAGLLSAFSPCVYPLIPITLGHFASQYGQSNKWHVFFFVLGQTLMFVFLGHLAVSAGQALGFSSSDMNIQLVMGLVLCILGIFSLSPRLGQMLSQIKIPGVSQVASPKPTLKGAFLFGASSALLISPCTSPILSGVLTLIAGESTFLMGIGLMLTYALGFTLIFLVLGLGLVQLSQLPKAGKWLNFVHKLSGLLLLSVGMTYLYWGLSEYFI